MSASSRAAAKFVQGNYTESFDSHSVVAAGDRQVVEARPAADPEGMAQSRTAEMGEIRPDVKQV